jgi:hypothetical protein
MRKPWLIVFSLGAIFGAGLCSRCSATEVSIAAGETIIRGGAAVLEVGVSAPFGLLHPGDAVELDAIEIASSTWKTEPLRWSGGDTTGPNHIVRALYVTRLGPFSFGTGLAWMARPLPYNGEDVNFALAVSYQPAFAPLVLAYGHLSDAGLKDPNYGRDFISMGVRFR